MKQFLISLGELNNSYTSHIISISGGKPGQYFIVLKKDKEIEMEQIAKYMGLKGYNVETKIINKEYTFGPEIKKDEFAMCFEDNEGNSLYNKSELPLKKEEFERSIANVEKILKQCHFKKKQ